MPAPNTLNAELFEHSHPRYTSRFNSGLKLMTFRSRSNHWATVTDTYHKLQFLWIVRGSYNIIHYNDLS